MCFHISCCERVLTAMVIVKKKKKNTHLMSSLSFIFFSFFLQLEFHYIPEIRVQQSAGYGKSRLTCQINSVATYKIRHFLETKRAHCISSSRTSPVPRQGSHNGGRFTCAVSSVSGVIN